MRIIVVTWIFRLLLRSRAAESRLHICLSIILILGFLSKFRKINAEIKSKTNLVSGPWQLPLDSEKALERIALRQFWGDEAWANFGLVKQIEGDIIINSEN